MTENEYTEAAASIVRKFVPSYTLKQKSDSWFMKLVGWLFAKINNPYFMKEFWTTIGSTTYRPTITDTQPYKEEFTVIMHEGKHSLQAKKYTIFLWAIGYLVPQCLGVLLPILFLCFGHWIVAILCLGFLAPLPSPLRAYFEYDAYKVSICADYWTNNGASSDEDYVNYFIDWLADGSYYYCWPFKSMLLKSFLKHVASLRDGSIEMTDYLIQCKQLCDKYRTEGVS